MKVQVVHAGPVIASPWKMASDAVPSVYTAKLWASPLFGLVKFTVTVAPGGDREGVPVEGPGHRDQVDRRRPSAALGCRGDVRLCCRLLECHDPGGAPNGVARGIFQDTG